MTAGIYCIRNESNGRVYVGSSVNIERRMETHFEDLGRGSHHSWKLQKDWNKFGEQHFKHDVIHQFDLPDEHIELLLEIYERYEVVARKAVSDGYNVSDEIIRDTSLVLKFCDETICTYFRVNKDRFDAVTNRAVPVGIFSKIKRWVGNAPTKNSSTSVIDVEHHAVDYLHKSLVDLFLKCGLDNVPSKILAEGYVVDVKKMRGNNFKYWRAN